MPSAQTLQSHTQPASSTHTIRPPLLLHRKDSAAQGSQFKLHQPLQQLAKLLSTARHQPIQATGSKHPPCFHGCWPARLVCSSCCVADPIHPGQPNLSCEQSPTHKHIINACGVCQRPQQHERVRQHMPPPTSSGAHCASRLVRLHASMNIKIVIKQKSLHTTMCGIRAKVPLCRDARTSRALRRSASRHKRRSGLDMQLQQPEHTH